MRLDLNSSPPDDEGGGAEPEQMEDRSFIDLNQFPQPDVQDADPG